MSNQLPSGWKYKRLADVADVISGGTPSRDVDEFWHPGEIEWVTPTDITRGNTRTLKEAKEKISKKGLTSSSAKLLPVNTVLMTSRATLGEMKVSTFECCTNQGFKSLIPKVKTDVWFLYYQMMRKKPEYEALGIGSTFLEVNKKDTASFLIEFPPYAQQQKIAKILTTVDDLIEKTQALIDKYTAIKQGMMADLFTRGIDLSGTPATNPNHGQLRPPYEQAPELYKQTELGWVPKEWEAVLIDEISNQMTNGFVGVATPHYTKNDEQGGQYLYGNNVRANKLELHNVLTIKLEFHEKLRKSQLQRGDMLTVQSGHIGTSAVVPAGLGEANCHALIITRFIGSKVIPEFISYYLNSAIGMNRMEVLFVGSTIKHVNVKELKAFMVPLPSIEEQEILISKIIAAGKLVDDYVGNLEKYQCIKKGLMQDLLTGKVQVKD